MALVGIADLWAHAPGRKEDSLEVYAEACASARMNDVGKIGHVRVHANLGRLFESMDRLEEAGESFREALRVGPGSASTWNSYGYLLGKSANTIEDNVGLREEAVAAYGRGLRLDPWDDTAEGARAVQVKRGAK